MRGQRLRRRAANGPAAAAGRWRRSSAVSRSGSKGRSRSSTSSAIPFGSAGGGVTLGLALLCSGVGGWGTGAVEAPGQRLGSGEVLFGLDVDDRQMRLLLRARLGSGGRFRDPPGTLGETAVRFASEGKGGLGQPRSSVRRWRISGSGVTAAS